MIIELVGLPASGKTTLARLLADTGTNLERNLSTGGTLRRARAKMRTVRIYWKPIGFGVRGLLPDSRPWGHKIRAVRWLVSTFEPYATSDRATTSTVLSEGPVQRAVLLFYDANKASWNESLLMRYLSCAPLSDLVVYLDVETSAAVDRYLSRAQSEVREFERFEASDVPLTDHLRTISEGLNRCLAYLAGRRSNVIRVTSIDEGREAIVQLFKDFE